MQWSEGSSGSFEQAPAGTHVARCIKLIDIGTQHGEYNGEPKVARKVIIGWELPNEVMQNGEYAGQPFVTSEFYTQSLHEKSNLRQELVKWRGRDFTAEELKGFDAKNILGKPCMVSITHNDKGRAKVAGVMALPKGTVVPDQVNPMLYFSLTPGEFDQSVFDAFSDKMKAIIASSDEYKAMQDGGKQAASDPSNGSDFSDDDIPFAPLARRRHW